MKANPIIEILILRDGMSPENAKRKLDECRKEFEKRTANNDMSAYDICNEYFELGRDFLNFLEPLV